MSYLNVIIAPNNTETAPSIMECQCRSCRGEDMMPSTALYINQNINLHCLQDGRWLSPDDKPPPDLVINQPASTASKSSLLQVSFGMNWTIQACFTSSFVSLVFCFSALLHILYLIWLPVETPIPPAQLEGAGKREETEQSESCRPDSL